ncbi:MAG: cbb3-type cytochrome c oxidase subunit I [Candidatus Methylacidiphilaceae bacterium]
MYRSQRLALRYFWAAMLLFGVMIAAGLLASLYYLRFGFLLNTFHFSTAKILHIDTLILWLLMGFLGSVYWFLPMELEREVEWIGWAEKAFMVFVVTVAAVAAILILVQYGGTHAASLWLINQGRKFVEAPRWASLLIAGVIVLFGVNVVGTAVRARKMTGILGVLIADLVPLTVLYLNAFSSEPNMSKDLFWWWWLIHLWVEATWEVFIGCILAWSLLHLLGASRAIVESWLYVEVALVLGTGILGLGHHYFWIGTPSYWLGIGGFFSALEPLPLLGMVIHAVYDAGAHQHRVTNRPAFAWLLAEAFGNFLGAGVWGFMMTLPQINLFAHGTQWTASHAHFSFWGAYGCAVLSVIYLVLQKVRAGTGRFESHAWKWAFALLNVGLVGMSSALLIAGMAQAFFERAIGGSTFQAFLTTQANRWVSEGLQARLLFGLVFAAGYLVLLYDFWTIGKGGRAAEAPLPKEVTR